MADELSEEEVVDRLIEAARKEADEPAKMAARQRQAELRRNEKK